MSSGPAGEEAKNAPDQQLYPALSGSDMSRIDYFRCAGCHLEKEQEQLFKGTLETCGHTTCIQCIKS